MSRKTSSRPPDPATGSGSDSPGKSPDKTVGEDADLSPAARRAAQIRVGAQRETVEAFVVAFILALLFRGFLAEAFVIPTGSMAPTLMGAHKEIDCERCDQRFRIGASNEQRGPVTENVVVGGVCPNCRYANALDLREEPNDATFSGDRILVSKFAYTLADPERWDVIVFKFPGNPKQNYIKRLVGLPGETITVRHGDVFARPVAGEGDDVIVRKPAETLLAMRHLIYDSDQQAPALIEANYPSRLQPWRSGGESPPEDSWQIRRAAEGLVAKLDADVAGDTPRWLRYYHRWPSQADWDAADDGQSLADVNPYDSRAITDFYAYNSFAIVNAGEVYDVQPATFRGKGLQRLFGSGYYGGEFRSRYSGDKGLEQFRDLQFGSYRTGADGMHWVGDLIVEADVQPSADAKELILELVEAGVKFRCRFDLATGQARLAIDDAGTPGVFDAAGGSPADRNPSAVTDVVAGGRHSLRFSQCDDQLLLWVDGDLVVFDSPTTFDGRNLRGGAASHPRYAGPGDPLDASPVGIAVAGGPATVHRVRIDRDKYYVATDDANGGVHDYDLRRVVEINGNQDMSRWGPRLQQLFTRPADWSSQSLWDARRSVSFDLQADQYFPMGDNSPESLDARCWARTKEFGQPRSVDQDAYLYSEAHYVPRDLLVGKALMVFWPHPWNAPVPFTPNFKRMKLIR